MNRWDDFINDDGKMRVSFHIEAHGKKHILESEYSDTVLWTEILDDIVGVLEATFGYSFDLDIETESGKIGIYYSGKENDSE